MLACVRVTCRPRSRSPSPKKKGKVDQFGRSRRGRSRSRSHSGSSRSSSGSSYSGSSGSSSSGSSRSRRYAYHAAVCQATSLVAMQPPPYDLSTASGATQRKGGCTDAWSCVPECSVDCSRPCFCCCQATMHLPAYLPLAAECGLRKVLTRVLAKLGSTCVLMTRVRCRGGSRLPLQRVLVGRVRGCQ